MTLEIVARDPFSSLDEAAEAAGLEGALVVLVGQDRALGPSATAVDRASSGQLARAMVAERFRGQKDELVELIAPPGLAVGRVIALGVGNPAEADARVFEELGGALAARLETKAETAVFDVAGAEGFALPAGEAAARLAHGAALRAWRLDDYRSAIDEKSRPRFRRLVVAGGCPEEAGRLAALETGVRLARTLVTQPPNHLYPESFCEAAQAALEPLGVEVEVLDEDAIRAEGMGAFLGVAQGSARPPRLLAMRWRGAKGKGAEDVEGAEEASPPLLLVGKGITFDSGGISLKPGAGMEDMKFDMGGAAAVVGTMAALAGRRAQVDVAAVCPLAENMPDGRAQRPGDIVRTGRGLTVEVLNTDAEGRLVLCDAMWWGQKRWSPKVMLDLATLTGAIIIALGHEHAGLFTLDDALAGELIAAGVATGETLWRQPLGPARSAYDKLIDSPIADMKNVGPREAGSTTAAQFLARFVDEGVVHAHLDIAGTVWKTKPGALHARGATGWGVRLVDRWIAQRFERDAGR